MLDDPRLERLTVEERSWMQFYLRRIAEILRDGDPLWASSHPDERARSKTANLIGLVRRYGGKSVDVLARPMGQAHETPEFAFMRARYDNADPDFKAQRDVSRR